MLKKILKPLSSYYRLLKKFKNHNLVKALTPFPYTPKFHDQTKLEIKDNNILISPYNFNISPGKLKLFQNAHGILEQFIKSDKINFQDDLVIIKEGANSIKIDVSSSDNLVAINEVYIEEIYNFYPIKGSSYIVMDIGMNIATASLYFAAQPWVQHVVAYEPFKTTYQEGLGNISLNHALKEKIKANNFGISDVTKEVSGKISGSGSLGGNTAHIENTQINPDTETVQLKSITEELSNLCIQYPNSRFVLKIDCEGEEYAIINKLTESDLLGKVDVLMLEYHFKGKHSLIEALQKKGYIAFSPYSNFDEFGMIYAFKQ